MGKKHFYAVVSGRTPGVFPRSDYDRVAASVAGFPNAIYRGFHTEQEAREWYDSCLYKPREEILESNSDKTDYYAICVGRGVTEPQVFRSSWAGIKDKVMNYPGVVFKKFKNVEEAQAFVDDYNEENSREYVLHPLDKPVGSKRRHEERQDRPLNLANFGHGRGEGLTGVDDFYVYTDGSCFDNGKTTAKAGFGVVFLPVRQFSSTLVLYGPAIGKKTSNSAELQAILSSLYLLRRLPRIEERRAPLPFRTDSELACKALKGMYILKDLKLARLLDEIKVVLSSPPFGNFEIEWGWIRSHSTSTGNNLADELARMGAMGESNEVYRCTLQSLDRKKSLMYLRPVPQQSVSDDVELDFS